MSDAYKVEALRARLADTSMRWSRSHIEGLINQIAELTKQRDEGWNNFYALRKQVAEERYPGMTGAVRAHGTSNLRNIVISLKAFASHSDGCPVAQWMPDDPEDFDCPPCNCGLERLLAEATEAFPLPAFPPETAIPTEQFNELAAAYGLTAGRERADALRWFMLGRRSRVETTTEPVTAVDAEMVAAEVIHHIDTMYPKMWEGVPRTARISVRNCMIREIENPRNQIELEPSAEPKAGDAAVIHPILGCPHVPQEGWTVDRVEHSLTYYLRHPTGGYVTVPRDHFTVKTGGEA